MNGDRINEGYVIEKSVIINGNEYVLGHNNAGMYVTWACANGSYYYGHYTESKKAAMNDLYARAFNELNSNFEDINYTLSADAYKKNEEKPVYSVQRGGGSINFDIPLSEKEISDVRDALWRNDVKAFVCEQMAENNIKRTQLSDEEIDKIVDSLIEEGYTCYFMENYYFSFCDPCELREDIEQHIEQAILNNQTKTDKARITKD